MDFNDSNGDGRTTQQLVEVLDDGTFVRMLCDNMSPAISPQGGAGYYDAPLGGIMFQQVGDGIQVTLIMRRLSVVSGPTVVGRLDQLVIPKN